MLYLNPQWEAVLIIFTPYIINILIHTIGYLHET